MYRQNDCNRFVYNTYKFLSHALKPCNIARDRGITAQSNLKLGLHFTQLARKANARSKLVLKCFVFHDPTILTHALFYYSY